MFDPARRIIGRLVIALGLILGGSGPVWAAPHAMTATAMAMMPGMAMDHDAGAAKHTPVKPTPCGNQDCGCCTACPCAPPPCLAQTEMLRQVASPDGIPVRDDVASGITFPPSLRPPIAA